MLPPFEAARIKLARADQHIQDLNKQISNFFEGGGAFVAFEMANEYSAATKMPTAAFTYRQPKPIPPEWSAIIGDAVHNLRTALDLIVSDVHRITGGNPKDTPHVHYPFCREKNALADMIRSRRLSGIGRDYLDLIHETAPFKGGNEGLRAIHDLDLRDKHQALIPAVAVAKIDWPIPVKDGSQFVTNLYTDGQRLMIFPQSFAAALPVGSKVKADILIVFGDVGRFAGARSSFSCEPALRPRPTSLAALPTSQGNPSEA